MNQMNHSNLRPALLDGTPKRLLIDGKWVAARSGKTFQTFNPTTGEALDPLAEGDAADIDLAVAAARRALDGPWSRFKPSERQRMLLNIADLIDRNYDELAMIEALDMGQPVMFHVFLKRLVLDIFRYFAGQAVSVQGDTFPNSAPGNIFSYTVKEPVGVVGAIIPWNGPLTAATMKIAPALAAGCTLVVKPAEQAALGVIRLGELCMEAGLPEGVLNIVTGYGATAGAALAAHMDVDKISFTGSTATGQAIIRASAGNIKKLTLELGGKSPDIVMADADMDVAVPGAAMASFANSGQACIAGSRLYVQRPIFEEFTRKVADFARTLRIGDPLDPDTQLGPLASKQHHDRVSGYIASGIEQGARPLCGGRTPAIEGFPDGYFIEPTVFVDVHDDMKIAREEIFGPVISAMPFDDLDEVIGRANRSTYGLGGGIWTTSIKNAHKVANRVKSGSIWVNCWLQMDAAVPLGGYKMSGYGSELGKYNIGEYMSSKTVWINTD